MLTFAVTFLVSLVAMFGVYWAIALRPEAAEHDMLRKRLAGAGTAAGSRSRCWSSSDHHVTDS